MDSGHALFHLTPDVCRSARHKRFRQDVQTKTRRKIIFCRGRQDDDDDAHEEEAKRSALYVPTLKIGRGWSQQDSTGGCQLALVCSPGKEHIVVFVLYFALLTAQDCCIVGDEHR